MMGAFAAVYVGVKWTFLPGGIHCLVAMLGRLPDGRAVGRGARPAQGLLPTSMRSDTVHD